MKDTKKKIKSLIIILIMIGISYCCEQYLGIELFSDEIKTEYKIEETKPVINTETPQITNDENKLKVYFLDVGQGDSILINNNGKYALIDAGREEDGEKLVSYFNSLGIKKFQYVIGTHAHEDHIGGMDNIINNFEINHFYMPDQITTTKTFEEVLDALDNKNLNFETPKIDSKFNLENAKFNVLSIENNQQDLNDTSIVLKMNYYNTSYLFTGDATTKIEKKILEKDIKSDVLKVGHHGSQYSNSASFLKKVDPKYAIIQVGKNNVYNHPKKIVLDKLKKLNTKIYRTDQDGTILLESDGQNITINKLQTDTKGSD